MNTGKEIATNPVGALIAMAAVRALRDPSFENRAGYCQRFVRQVVQAVSDKYNRFWEPTALGTMLAFHGSQYEVWSKIGEGAPLASIPDLKAGDLVYKGTATSGGFGHVGILFHNVCDSVLTVAENSSFHVNPEHDGNVSGAKGFRTIPQFGRVESVIRLK